MSMEIERSHCFICDKLLPSFDNNIRGISSTYSSSLLVDLLEKLLSEKISASDPCCCEECTKKLNDYDLAMLTALNIENELLDMYRKKNIEYYVEEVESHIEDGEDRDELSDDMLTELIDEDGDMDMKEEMELVEYVYEVEEDAASPVTPPSATKKKKRGRRRNVDVEDDDDDNETDVKQQTGKRLQCHQCRLDFDTKVERLEHMRLHRKKNSLICDICGQTYKSKAALDIHVGIHNGVSPHECQVCGKKFTQKGALVRHMPLHTGVHPYQVGFDRNIFFSF